MLADIKMVLGITADAKDYEILDLIESAKLDMKISGVDIDKGKVGGEYDPLIKRAVTLYCQSYFWQDNATAERFAKSYRSLKDHLALSSDYREVASSV